MSALKYWNGTQWVTVEPVVPSGLVEITNQTLATPGSGNVAYTTLDVSAYVPVGAKAVELNVSIGGTRIAATFATNLFTFRRDASSAPVGSVGCSVAGTGSAAVGTQVFQMITVPLTTACTLQYKKDDNLVASSGGTIVLVGYWI